MTQTVPETSELEVAGKTASLKDANGSVDWQKRCQELTAERDKLRKDLSEVKEERAAYLHALLEMFPEKEYTFTKEELFAQICKNPSLDDLIAEVDRDLEK
jgi:hypothetical protein